MKRTLRWDQKTKIIIREKHQWEVQGTGRGMGQSGMARNCGFASQETTGLFGAEVAVRGVWPRVGTAGPCATPSISPGWKAGPQCLTVDPVGLPHSCLLEPLLTGGACLGTRTHMWKCT